MAPTPPEALPAAVPPRAAMLIPLALLALLPLFPPEARGESLAGCAALIAVWALALRGRTPSAIPIWALVGTVPVGTGLVLLADAPGSAVAPAVFWLLALAAGCCAAAARPLRELERHWLPVIAVAAALAACHGLYQSLWGLDALVDRLDAGLVLAEVDLVRERALRGRAFAGFPTPAALGGFLALAMPATAGAAIAASGRRRAWLAVACAVQALGFVAAASATAILALVGAVMMFLLLNSRTRRWAALAMVVGVALLGSLAVLRDDGVFDPAHPENPVRLRMGNFRIATEIAADHPWAGVGPGGYAEAYPRYRRSADNESRHAHNLPLEALSELGIPLGALAAVGFFTLFLGPLWRRSSREYSAWERGIAVGLAAFAFHNLGDFTAFLPSLLWLAAVLRGALYRDESRESSWVASGWIPLVAALAVAAAGIGLADNRRDAAMHARARGQAAEAARLAAGAVRLAPWNVDGWMLWSAAASDAGRPAEALSRIEKAVTLSPVRPGARALRARARLACGDLPGAWADADSAARFYPLRRRYDDERGQLRSLLPKPGAGESP